MACLEVDSLYVDPIKFFEDVYEASKEEENEDEEDSKEEEKNKPLLPTPPPLLPTPQPIEQEPEAQLTAYDKFRLNTGCNLVFSKKTGRNVMVLRDAVPKPTGFCLGSPLYNKRLGES
jgi:hypothetical protein